VIKYITILDIAYNIEVAKNLFNTGKCLKIIGSPGTVVG